MSMSGSLTSVPGVEVGHYTDTDAVTGVTVMTFPEPNVAAVELRGAAPGTREVGLLAPGMKVEVIQALVFSGGSAYGLAAADGVMAGLEADGRGHPKDPWVVPLVPAAIIYDLFIGDGAVRPGPDQGAIAYRTRSDGPVPMGSVGAGTGAAIAMWRGEEAARKGGIGSASVKVGDATLGALVVLNAGGDIFTMEGEPLTGGELVPDYGRMAVAKESAGTREQTTLVALATDAKLRRVDLLRLCVRAHDALGACIRPVHTRYDGDAVFAVSCGDVNADLDATGEAAFVVVGYAIEAAVGAATSLGGLRSMRDRP